MEQNEDEGLRIIKVHTAGRSVKFPWCISVGNTIRVSEHQFERNDKYHPHNKFQSDIVCTLYQINGNIPLLKMRNNKRVRIYNLF